MKRILDLMRGHSIGINSVNYILNIFNLKFVTPNCRISDEEYDFLLKILNSGEIKEIYELQKQIDVIKQQVSHIEPDFKLPHPEEINIISKQYFFSKILSMKGGKCLFDYLKIDRLYTEDSYKTIYDWCNNNNSKTSIDIQAAVYKFYSNIIKLQDYELGYEKSKATNKKIIDDESVIMGALRNGCGDKFGL